MARTTTGVPLTVLRDFAVYLLKKMGYMALFWVVIYFYWRRGAVDFKMGIIMMLGGLAGLVIGWFMAEDAVERSSFTGMTLWVTLVIASWIPIWLVEVVLKLITGWPLTFGRWMCITAALLLALASAVWRASADD
jgi:uncharacterized membrane protein YfcA